MYREKKNPQKGFFHKNINKTVPKILKILK